MDEFFDWCHKERQRPELTKTNPLSKVLAYAENYQTSLRVFLDDPDVQMDTNHLERLLWCTPMERKNYLVSCRLQDIDPYNYLVDVLQRVSLHPARQINELIPRNWKEHFAKFRFSTEIFQPLLQQKKPQSFNNEKGFNIQANNLDCGDLQITTGV